MFSSIPISNTFKNGLTRIKVLLFTSRHRDISENKRKFSKSKPPTHKMKQNYFLLVSCFLFFIFVVIFHVILAMKTMLLGSTNLRWVERGVRQNPFSYPRTPLKSFLTMSDIYSFLTSPLSPIKNYLLRSITTKIRVVKSDWRKI